jgi:hypothetical protein
VKKSDDSALERGEEGTLNATKRNQNAASKGGEKNEKKIGRKKDRVGY